MSAADKYALPLPANIVGVPDDGATAELLRLWWKNGEPEMSVRPAITDMRLMGAILAEASWNLAHAYAQTNQASLGEAVKALREGWTMGHARSDAANPGVVP